MTTLFIALAPGACAMKHFTYIKWDHLKQYTTQALGPVL